MKIISEYQEWLSILNYCEPIIKNCPNRVAHFFHWTNTKDIQGITSEKLTSWFNHHTTRINKTQGGALSLASLKNYHVSMNRFNRYLQESNQGSFEMPIQFKGKSWTAKEILTQEEIQQLYQATENYFDPSIENKGILAVREKVLLGIFYGCGLRRTEGANLLVKDLNLQTQILHVRQGKNYQERYVPIPEKVVADIKHYLAYSRPQLLRKNKSPYLFISWYSQRLQKESLANRLQILCELAGIRRIGLHQLRHSIATHLLQNGMKLDQIAQFLGHKSLESTQIYTRMNEQLLKKKTHGTAKKISIRE